MTMVECPSEKKKPTEYGDLPFCISLRTTLSMAAMWSASKAVVMSAKCHFRPHAPLLGAWARAFPFV
jgi:hypothetical protein